MNTTRRPGHRMLVVGDIVTDILAVHSGSVATGSDTPASISVTGGGSAANTAAWLASAGCPVDLVGVAGVDANGDDRIAELKASGVGCRFVRRSADAPTGSVIVLAHEAERSFLCDRGANLLLVPSDVDAALNAVDDAVHLHLSGYTLLDASSLAAGRHALAAAADRGLSTSVDAASAAPLRRVGGPAFLGWAGGTDVLFANLDEARTLLEDDELDPSDLARALARFARHAAVKLGAAGAVWADKDGTVIEAPAVPASAVIDATGAGDAFAAGVLVAWLAGEDPATALHSGARLGASAVSVVGGRPPRAMPPLRPMRQVRPPFGAR